MKIAAVTDDGVTISPHFGRARFYVVATFDNGVIAGKETRPKVGHHTFAVGSDHESGEHHSEAAQEARHVGMLDAISDCQVLLARGMGQGAFESFRRRGIQPFVTDIVGIEEAVNLYASGELASLAPHC